MTKSAKSFPLRANALPQQILCIYERRRTTISTISSTVQSTNKLLEQKLMRSATA